MRAWAGFAAAIAVTIALPLACATTHGAPRGRVEQAYELTEGQALEVRASSPDRFSIATGGDDLVLERGPREVVVRLAGRLAMRLRIVHDDGAGLHELYASGSGIEIAWRGDAIAFGRRPAAALKPGRTVFSTAGEVLEAPR